MSSEKTQRKHRKTSRKEKFKKKISSKTQAQTSSGKRRKRLCPVPGCNQTYVNVTNHRKKHPDVPEEHFFFDKRAKEKGLGCYKKYHGYKCCFCGEIIKGFKEHCRKKHNEQIDIKSEQFKTIEQQCVLNVDKFAEILRNYEKVLVSMGVGKRNTTTTTQATTYRKQVEAAIPTLDTIYSPDTVYQNLHKKVGTDSASAGTFYAYLATLSNFIEFLTTDYPDIEVKKLQHYVQRWLAKQRKQKEKREQYVKEKSRKKLKDLDTPYKAILQYESNKKIAKEIDRIRNTKFGNLKKTHLELLLGDIFCRVICRLGCRGGIFRGMRRDELLGIEETAQGNFSILVEKQKEQNRHGCIVLSKLEYDHLKVASDHAWAFIKQEPGEKSQAFPSLVTAGAEMESNTFNRLFKLVSIKVFEMAVSATDVRKVITTKMRDAPAEVQKAVARSEGHSIEMANRVYDLSHPLEIVETARMAMEEAVSKDISQSPPDQESSESESGETTSTTTTTNQKTSTDESLYIMVQFVDDEELLQIFRISDLRSLDNKKFKDFSQIPEGGLCRARWPADKLFYKARRLQQTLCTPTKAKCSSDSEASPKKRRLF